MTLLDFAKKHGYNCVSVGLNSHVAAEQTVFFYGSFVHFDGKCFNGRGDTALEAIKNAHMEAQADRAAQAVRNKLRVVK